MALGVAGGWIAACASPMAFTCLSDEDCSGGSCVMGLCAFEDADCESGLRFGDAAGEVANECVVVEGSGSTSMDTNGSSDESASHGGSTLGVDPDSSGGTTGVGPDPMDPGATGSVGDSGTDTGGVGESSVGSGPGTQSYELISNGDFSAGESEWTTENNPDSVAPCDFPDDPNVVFQEQDGYMLNEASEGPNAHVLYQDFDVPFGASDAVFSIAYAQDNEEPLDPQNVSEIIKDCLDASEDGLGQNALRVDIVDPNDDVFTSPILLELATPQDPAGNAFDPSFDVLTFDGSELLDLLQNRAGSTLRLRIGKVESTFPWPVALDDVSLMVEAGT